MQEMQSINEAYKGTGSCWHKIQSAKVLEVQA